MLLKALACPKYVALPAGIIKGALSRIGFHGTVVPEITTPPQCELSSFEKIILCDAELLIIE
jgi:hypothetical protein